MNTPGDAMQTASARPVEIDLTEDRPARSTDLERLLEVIRARRATRRFRSDPVSEHVLNDLLDAARWAPSGYNLQPTTFVVVSDPDQRAALKAACMDQQQITQAPIAVVFVGDRRVVQSNFENVIKHERAAGGLNDQYEPALRKYVGLAFNAGPLGLGWLGKAMLPMFGRFMCIPSIPAVQRRYWLAKQTSLAAMNFMLAAEAAGLATCPMEGFDERRVRRALGIPRCHLPILVTPLGYSDGDATKMRLPLADLVHRDRWR